MNNREAANVAWHARVNGLDGISKENLVGALAVLERLVDEVDGLRRERDAVVEQYRSTCSSLQVVVEDARVRLNRL